MMNWPLIIGCAIVGTILWGVLMARMTPPSSIVVRTREDGCRWETRKVEVLSGRRDRVEAHFLISPAGEILAKVERLQFGVRATVRDKCYGEYATALAAMAAVDYSGPHVIACRASTAP